MKFSTIFLDMDGVLSNFHLEAVRAHLRAGRRLPHIHSGEPLQLGGEALNRAWPRGYSLQKFLSNQYGKGQGMSTEDFWEPIRKDPMFWRVIPPYPNYKELVKLLEGYCEELVITTSADFSPWCYSGKREWLAIHGLDRLEYVTIKRKWRLADPTCLILDDFEDHIKAWRRTIRKRWGIEGSVLPPRDKPAPTPIGCHTILYPQPWNQNHPHLHEQLPFVERCLQFYLNPRQSQYPNGDGRGPESEGPGAITPTGEVGEVAG